MKCESCNQNEAMKLHAPFNWCRWCYIRLMGGTPKYTKEDLTSLQQYGKQKKKEPEDNQELLNNLTLK